MNPTIYREYTPTPQLAFHVECFWTMRVVVPGALYPVLPDGCVDILFTRERSGTLTSKAVGAMTRPGKFVLPAGRFVFGLRFRPAMARGFLRLPISELTDRSISLDVLWGGAARRLGQQLAEARSIAQAIARLEAHLAPRLYGLPPRGPGGARDCMAGRARGRCKHCGGREKRWLQRSELSAALP